MRFTFFVVLAFAAATAGRVWAHPPHVKPAQVFAGGLSGPEGLAFTADGALIVGSTTGELRRFTPSGGSTVLANVGDRLASITVTEDGRVLAAAFNAGRVWSVEPDGSSSILASGISGPNFIVETRGGHILVSASLAGAIVDITTGTPVVRSSALSFPNGMAIGADHFLYVAETLLNRVSRLPLDDNGTLGAPQVYATGLPLADGIAFDRNQNLLVAGNGGVRVYVPRISSVITLDADPLFFGPSNLAFGRGKGFSRRDVYLANFGPALGNGTNVIRFRYNHAGVRLVR